MSVLNNDFVILLTKNAMRANINTGGSEGAVVNRVALEEGGPGVVQVIIVLENSGGDVVGSEVEAGREAVTVVDPGLIKVPCPIVVIIIAVGNNRGS